MKVNSVNNGVYPEKNEIAAFSVNKKRTAMSYASNNANNNSNSVAFRGNLSKQFWFKFRNLSNYMKEPSEMTNALIAMIGTGGIAPFAIMCSPKKKSAQEQDQKADKDKKFFQALRQPVSAFLAFAFQVPTTIGIAMGLNKLAYQKNIKFFDDDILGHLIPDKKYLKKRARNALDKGASSELKEAWAEELKLANDEKTITKELKNQIKQEYKEVGIDVSEEELDKLAGKKSRRNKFIAEKMADAKQEKLIDIKVQELSNKHYDIKDTDLVTESYQKLAKQRFKEEFASLKENAKLNWFDKFIETMGFSNKKLNTLNNQIKELAQNKGLLIIKQEIQEGKTPDIFNDNKAKLRKFIENRIGKSQKLYANKIFWLTLVTNLFMVAVSCVALNWLHPKFADFIDNTKDKWHARKASADKKVEVSA